MQDLTVVRCGASPRMERLLEGLAKTTGNRQQATGDAGQNLPCPQGRGTGLKAGGEASPDLLLFAISVDKYGPDEEYTKLLRRVRAGEFVGCLAAVIVVGETELDTKAVGRELIFHLDRAGCAFPERPLVEATGSMRNLRIVQKNLELPTPEDALLAAAKSLLERLQSFSPPRFDAPRLLVLHASDHKTSNTLCLGDMVLEELDPRFQVRTLSLRNGTIEDCRGCSFKVCSHYANKGSCFYGGSIAQEVLPAIRDCDALLLLLPNYNDSVGANIMAFINRLTSLHVNNELSGRRLYAIVVSGYSGGELVATQAMGALCLNKSFLLPPAFCMLETSNDPGEIQQQPSIRDRAAAFARRMEQELLFPEQSRGI